MDTFLFAWSPQKFAWPDIAEQAQALRQGEKIEESWTCSSYKKVKPGDRAFVAHVGADPRGLFASGYVSSAPFPGKNRKGNDCYRVMITLDVLLDPATEPILTLDLLNMGRMAKQVWTPQSSGISIKEEIVEELELLWADFLADNEGERR